MDKEIKLAFSEIFSIVEPDNLNHWESRYGNNYIRIYKEDIEALLAGKILYNTNGEYGCFVMLGEENDE